MRRLALVLVLALSVGACGAGEETEPEARGISAQQVSAEFAAEAGEALEPAAVEGEAWEQLGYGLDPAPALSRRYGVFTVYVVEPGNEEALESLLADKASGRPLQPDARGIHWELDSQSRTWVAHSRYGPNVVLTWFSERRRKGTDARWERLHRVLNGLGSAS